MRKYSALAFVSLVALFASLALARQTSHTRTRSNPPSGRLGVALKVLPQAAPERSYLCEAVITDLQSGEILSQPQSVVEAGSTVAFRAGVMPRPEPDSAIELVIHVSVDANGTEATYTIEYSRGGEVFYSQRASFQLRT